MVEQRLENAPAAQSYQQDGSEYGYIYCTQCEIFQHCRHHHRRQIAVKVCLKDKHRYVGQMQWLIECSYKYMS